MMERTEWYRLNAEKCLTLAHKSNDPESKRALLAMANAWLALAEQVGKKNKTVAVPDSPPHRITPIPPDKPDAS
jgi:hypothetical protein